MNLPSDRIRAWLLHARRVHTGAALDSKVAELLTDALIEARRTGDATESVLMGRFGFTKDELTLHGTAATDAATERWVQTGAIEAAA